MWQNEEKQSCIQRCRTGGWTCGLARPIELLPAQCGRHVARPLTRLTPLIEPSPAQCGQRAVDFFLDDVNK